MDDSVIAGDHHSNPDAMDIDPMPETVANGVEDSTNKKCESPQSSVSTVMLFPPSILAFFFCFFISGDLRY